MANEVRLIDANALMKRFYNYYDCEMIGYRCSECNTTWDAETNYCPNCGAKTDGDGDGTAQV